MSLTPASATTAPEDAAPAAGRRTWLRRGPRWCWATRILVVASTTWLVFIALHLLLTGRWWVWLIFDLVPPIAFLAVPVALLAALPLIKYVRRPVPRRPKWWVAGVALACLAATAGQSGVNVRALTSNPPPVPPGAVHVVAWNTEYWDQTDDPTRFYSYLRAQHADVYLLQEYLFWVGAGPQRIDEMARLRSAFPGYQIAVVGEEVTLSRFPIVATKALRTDPRADPSWTTVFDTDKVLRTDLRIGSATMSLYNVHIPVQLDVTANPLSTSFYTSIRDKSRERQAQYRALNRDVAANRNPLLIAGDFNTSPLMGDLHRLRSQTQDAARVQRSVYPASWRADVPLWRLDWTLLRGGARAYRYAFRDPHGMSDHRLQDLWITA